MQILVLNTSLIEQETAFKLEVFFQKLLKAEAYETGSDV